MSSELQIVLGGFSQGGAVALNTAYQLPYRLAGVCALSTYLPFGDKFMEKVSKESIETPLLLAHGDSDGMVNGMCACTWPLIVNTHLEQESCLVESLPTLRMPPWSSNCELPRIEWQVNQSQRHSHTQSATVCEQGRGLRQTAPQ